MNDGVDKEPVHWLVLLVGVTCVRLQDHMTYVVTDSSIFDIWVSRIQWNEGIAGTTTQPLYIAGLITLLYGFLVFLTQDLIL
jgi:hypothetical protein